MARLDSGISDCKAMGLRRSVCLGANREGLGDEGVLERCFQHCTNNHMHCDMTFRRAFAALFVGIHRILFQI